MKTNRDLKEMLDRMDENTTLGELQTYVNTMIDVRGFSKETEQEVMLLLTEEMGELAKEVRKSIGYKLDTRAEKKAHTGEEIADVFLYLLALCRLTGDDLLQSVIEKEKINCTRKWE